MLRYQVLVRVKGSNAEWEIGASREKRSEATAFARCCEQPSIVGLFPIYETKIVDLLKKENR